MNKTHKCDVCDKCFRDSYGLRRHVREGHKVVDAVKAGSDASSSHTNGDSKEIITKCPICTKPVIKLNKHLRLCHSVDKDLKPTFKQLRFQCQICDKPFRDGFNLSKHQKSCSARTIVEHRCDLCGKVFSSGNIMTRHKMEVHGASKTCVNKLE